MGGAGDGRGRGRAGTAPPLRAEVGTGDGGDGVPNDVPQPGVLQQLPRPPPVPLLPAETTREEVSKARTVTGKASVRCSATKKSSSQENWLV